jgi:hypothetical protein
MEIDTLSPTTLAQINTNSTFISFNNRKSFKNRNLMIRASSHIIEKETAETHRPDTSYGHPIAVRPSM